MGNVVWSCNGVEFKVGDKVRVMRQEESFAEGGMGNGGQWKNTWPDGMDAYLGLEFEIEDIEEHGATFVSEYIGYAFPLTSLDKVAQ